MKLSKEDLEHLDENKINICSTGRLIHQKGFDLLSP